MKPLRRTGVAGYGHEHYARSLQELGTPLRLPDAGGWLLRREIEGGGADAMSCYPLLVCDDWSALGQDLDRLAGEVVSVAVVTDPFATCDAARLQSWFPGACRCFKQHFVVDLEADPAASWSTNHRRNVKKGLRDVEVERMQCPGDHVAELWLLYQELTDRHAIQGVQRFSHRAFEVQLGVPGIAGWRATRGGKTVGIVVSYVDADVAYYHLAAYDKTGYASNASFAIFATMLADLKEQGLRWLSLGGGAGVREDSDDGLTRFKRGWATGVRPAYFCGRIYDRERYDALSRRVGATTTDYFPAYRQGEFR